MSIKVRLIIMNFLQFAVWGSYLTSMGSYLANIGMGENIGLFYAMQGIVSLFMPAILGIIADRWIPAQKLLSISHFLAAFFMVLAGYYGMTAEPQVSFPVLFSLYSLSVAFYMPTLALSNSVAYTALDQAGLDTIKYFPPIRIFGTIGFICSMWAIDLLGLQTSYGQFYACAVIGFIYGIYALTLPHCPVSHNNQTKSLVEALGLRAFTLFKSKKMAIFFIFSMLLGVSLQITNGFANPYISSFGSIPEYANTFGVQHANILISLSQVSETLCILLIPFFLSKFGIKRVMLIAMLAWVLRFALFGFGNPGSGVWMFILSMLVYGVAFDFFNISGSLFVDRETDISIRSSAQGLFVIMTNGFGATIGTLGAQAVVNRFVDFNSAAPQTEGWASAWFVFAGYALTVAVLFAIIFRYKHQPETANKK
ncbi:Nucleoside permease NupG [Bacteroides pyogenes]|uniref:nucleoside permease n=1 Tax=Bacteroides pyogenes TaxID=310300 RepID=UPI0011E4C3BD|nr:nucleoside permease [Bacteroides pyogenes]MBR8719239.1 Nucleoside permease NupG [Bacteroides pyogenes]MBR8726288.1 Nucleoside permease NupG [Bacteroides pyogenes]MBR8739650.1 Nucleoside permease NupG [Bacteroides pyogenes]MBR8755447.1 Nucleoside permease NupG [Bacteroides pyogenes]MBR8786116.1 Nucleoside permease NupG [Bacteroides pyogenes]